MGVLQPRRRGVSEAGTRPGAGRVFMAGLAALTCIALTTGVIARESDDDDDRDRDRGGPIPLTVPKAKCGPEDHPETALQGQVPAPLRMSGFKGFNCNLELVGTSVGEGASWQHAWFRDREGHRCSYYDTASPVDSVPPKHQREHLGVVVLDVTHAHKPTPTAYLSTSAMMDPWESLKVNERRKLLGAELSTNAAGDGHLDLYDVADDCTHPQLLSSVLTGS